FHGRHDLIDKYQKATIIGAAQAGPAAQAVDVVLRGPAFPDAALLAGFAGGETAALDVHYQPRAAVAVDDEVKVLDARFAEHGSARFVHGRVTEAVALELGPASPCVVVASV